VLDGGYHGDEHQDDHGRHSEPTDPFQSPFEAETGDDEEQHP